MFAASKCCGASIRRWSGMPLNLVPASVDLRRAAGLLYRMTG